MDSHKANTHNISHTLKSYRGYYNKEVLSCSKCRGDCIFNVYILRDIKNRKHLKERANEKYYSEEFQLIRAYCRESETNSKSENEIENKEKVPKRCSQHTDEDIEEDGYDEIVLLEKFHKLDNTKKLKILKIHGWNEYFLCPGDFLSVVGNSEKTKKVSGRNKVVLSQINKSDKGISCFSDRNFQIPLPSQTKKVDKNFSRETGRYKTKFAITAEATDDRPIY